MSIASDPKHCPKCQTPLPGDAPQGLCPKCLLAAAAIPTEAGQPAPDKTPPSLAELAAAFPQLEILELIGQGGMGFVFKARQPKLDRFVALKILPQSLAADPAFAERFSREGRVLAKLNHPNIVTIHDFGVVAGILPAMEPGFQPGGTSVESSAGLESSEAIASSDANPGGRMPPSTSGKMPDATKFYYLLMEFVDGVNLRQAMRAGRFTPDQALAIVPKICEALQFAHNEGILHRDIKPENILLDAKGRVKIADFGIAKLVGNDGRADLLVSQAAQQHRPTELHLTEAGKALGTPNYMAPEQRECSGEVDQRADIYSLGVVFYEMLTGELPLGRFAPPSEKSAADPRVDEVVLRALEKEKARRYASADEVKTQVETIAATPGSSRREEAQTEKSEIRNPKSEIVPRFSRTAIVGASWVPFCLIAFLMLSVKSVSTGEYHGPTWWQYLLMFTLLPLGITAPFGTTILGWIAVSQIRRSAGKLHGLWLAVFDGLLFPLLALDGIIFGLCYAVLKLIMHVLPASHWRIQDPGGFEHFLFLIWWISTFVISACMDAFIIRRVWRAVNAGNAPVPSSTSPRRAGRTLLVATAVVVLLGVIGLILSSMPSVSHRSPVNPASLADSPQELRKLPTAQVIEAGLAKPDSPWAWQELEQRPLTSTNVAQIMDGVDAWLHQKHPAGCDTPLNWLDNFLEKLNERHLLTDEQKIHFLTALHGDLRIGSQARMREGEWQWSLDGECRWIWRQDFLGFAMMNAPLSVTVDGQTVKSENNLRQDWGTQNLVETLFLSKLAPGKHRVKLEILSALVSKEDLVGLPRNAPPADWPPAKKRWTRAAEVELTVYPRDAVVISQTQEPALDPVRNGSLSVKSVIIHSKGAQAQAVLAFNLPAKDAVPMSFDVAVRFGGQTIPCGNMWSIQTAHGGSYSGEELTVDIARPAAEIKTADIILTPNPNPIEHMASVERIWGGQIVFSNVPLKRLDLTSAPNLSFGSVIERELQLFAPGATDFFLRMKTGEFLSPPKTHDPGFFFAWMTNNVNLALDQMEDGQRSLRFGLTVFNMTLSDFPSDNWNAAAPAEVQAVLGKATSLPHPQNRELAKRTYLLPEAPGSPLLAFSTTDGAQGLLQITGFTENPRGVKFRYKLVQSEKK